MRCLTANPTALVALVALVACSSPKPDGGTDPSTGGVDGAPVAVDDAGEVDEGDAVVIDLAVNDTDADGIDLTSIAIASPPAAGTVEPNSDGTVDYFHDGSEGGTDSFSYTIRDVTGAISNEATVEVSVYPVDDPVVAVDDTAQVDEGGSVIIDLAANDSDPDDGLDLGSIQVGTSPQFGQAVPLGDGTVEYTHNGNDQVADSFTYGIRNTNGDRSELATVSITIVPIDDPPTANDDSAAAVDGALTNIDAAANDVDPEGQLDPTSVAIVSPPSHGTATALGDGTVDYQHDGLGVLLDSFTYTVADAGGNVSNAATVVLADTACATHPQWMPVTCQTTDWVWSRDRNLATDVATADALQLLATGCYHSGNMQPDNGDGLCSLDGLGWVSIDQFPMQNCDTQWYHLGGAFSGNCGGHDTAAPADLYRHLVKDPLGCYSY